MDGQLWVELGNLGNQMQAEAAGSQGNRLQVEPGNQGNQGNPMWAEAGIQDKCKEVEPGSPVDRRGFVGEGSVAVVVVKKHRAH